MNEIIAKKKQGGRLSETEIRRVIAGVTSGEIPDYQVTALLMAICFRGMDVKERSYLTRAMAESGRKLDFSRVKGTKVDKHSTGGVGDKTSLMLAPWLAAAGRRVPMISGRGLGFTGGTLDKLAAIPGYRFDLTREELEKQLSDMGCFIIGQTADIAPADKKIYALRDVTATVDEISLITASILSKKLAEDLDVLVMDVKCGSGAFMQNLKDARALAKSIADTARSAGVETTCLITAMDFPLGRYTGNTAETFEALEFCRADGIYFKTAEKLFVARAQLSPEEKLIASLVEITVELAVAMLDARSRTDKKARSAALGKLMQLWQSRSLEKQAALWIKTQGGDQAAFAAKAAEITRGFAANKKGEVHTYRAAKAGFFSHADSRAIGNLMVDLGAGRKKSTDNISDEVTLEMLKAPGEAVKKGDAIFRVFKHNLGKNDAALIDDVAKTAIALSAKKPRIGKNILARL